VWWLFVSRETNLGGDALLLVVVLETLDDQLRYLGLELLPLLLLPRFPLFLGLGVFLLRMTMAHSDDIINNKSRPQAAQR
jgi:hypothetical protein